MAEFSEIIHATEDFPKEGVLYWDSLPLFRNAELLYQAVADIAGHIELCQATCLAAIEAKGFLLGGALASSTQLPLVAIRKQGLSPGELYEEKFKKEYGDGVYQMKCGELQGGERVYLVYDILAEAGATQAAINLVQRFGARVVGAGYIVELLYLNGRGNLAPLSIKSLIQVTEEKRHEHQAYKL